MTELISLPKEDLDRLQERVRRLAQEKSYLQLVNDLMARLSTVPGLENSVDAVLRLILDAVGGSNALLCFSLEGAIHCRDAYGAKRECAAVDDDLVRKAYETREPVEETLAFTETKMTVPAFTRAAHWAFPLLVGEELIGVLKLENVPLSDEVRERLQPSLTYAALVLKNEIENYARLKSAHDELNRANEKLQDYIAALTANNAELQQAYRDLQAAQSRILQQEKMASIGQLAAGVAHEINNPLGFIISNLGTLRKYSGKLMQFMTLLSGTLEELAAKGAPEAEDALKRSSEQRAALKIGRITEDMDSLITESLEGGERVKRIVQNLKSFARVSEQDYQLSDINECLEDTLAIVWNELKYKATVTKSYGDIARTMCNPGQLNQVFLNLLMNAAQAMDRQGTIDIETRQEGDWIVVTISDTGCGIPADQINRIFEPFFTTKDVGKGTGLGLSIAYDIVKKHDGEITVASAPVEGARFTVRLPVRRRSEGGRVGEALPAGGSDHG